MTIRWSSNAGVSPECIAEEVREDALRLFPSEPALQAVTGLSLPGVVSRYEQFFDAFADVVRARVPHASREFVLAVASHAGVAPADWYYRVMREVDSDRGKHSGFRGGR